MRARQSLQFGGRAALGISLVVFTVAVLWLGGAVIAADSPLANAAQLGDIETVRELIASGSDVNVPAGDGSTALLWASYQSYPEMAEALISAGADPNLSNNYGVTPLLQASRTGDSAVMAILLEAGADPTQTNPEGETPLMAASRSSSVAAVDLLLGRGADPNAAESFQNQTALMWASAEGHADVVGTLLGAGADPNLTGRVTTIDERKHADHATGGFTALHFAVRNGHEEVAKALIAGGADPALTNGDGATPTSIAIINDRFDLAKTLLDLGADADDGALYFAVDMRDATTDMRAHDGSRLRADHDNALTALDLVELLLDRGADPNKAFVGQLHSTTLCCAPKINSSPFYRAAVASDVEVLKMMLDHGAEVEWSPAKVETEDGEAGGRGNANAGRTPLMVTLTGGKGAPFAAGPGFTRLGAPPFRDESNREPLDAVKVLIAAGADPNLKMPDDSTPLHKAVEERQVAIIRELVAAGADLNAVDGENLTPLLVAETPPPPPPPGNNMDARTYRRPQDSREDVIATLREFMGLGPDDPAPVPPPLPEDQEDAEAGEEGEADEANDSEDSEDSVDDEDQEVAQASGDIDQQEPLAQ